MGRRGGVVELLEREYKDYAPLLKEIKKAAEQIVDNINPSNKNHNPNLNFLTISHGADADGLGSATVLSNMVGIVKDFYGQEVTPINNKVTRIMGFSKDRKHKDSLTQLVNNEKKDTFFLISDLGTLISKEFNDLTKNGDISNAVNIDHHKPANLNGYFNLNPLAHTKGLPELSGSSISAVLMHYVIKNLRDNLTIEQATNEKTLKNLKLIEKQADYLTLIGLAGDKSDMQGAKGLTKGLYDYMIKRRVLEKVKTPMHGYKTKSIVNVVAESDLPFNLKYRIAEPNIVRNILKLNHSTQLKKEDYDVIKKLFVMDSKQNGGVNSYYIQRLPIKEIDEINLISLRLTGNHLIDYSGESKTFIGKYDLEFNDFKDDIYKHSERQTNAGNLLNNIGLVSNEEKRKTASKCDGDEQELLLTLFKENMEVFSDYQNKERFDAIFNETNYCVKRNNFSMLKNWSPGEQGTYMTAMSKMGGGDYFMLGVEKELDIIKKVINKNDKDYGEITDILDDIYSKYQKTIFDCMGKIEEMIDTKMGFHEIKKNVYYMDMTAVRDIYEGKDNYDKSDYLAFVKMVGVLGGMAVKARLLPNHYGVLYTGIEDDGIMKISARVNLGPKQKADFGEFYVSAVEAGICINGGGHKEAASGRLKIEKFNEFKTHIIDYNLITKIITKKTA